MPDLATILLFCGVSFLMVATPGPGVLYVVGRSIDQGRTIRRKINSGGGPWTAAAPFFTLDPLPVGADRACGPLAVQPVAAHHCRA